MIEIRRIHAEELAQCRRIWTVVYNGREDFSKNAGKQDEKQEKENFENPPEWCWAVFENRVMKSCVNEIPFLMRFDNNDVKMSGIGGVGTLPESRNAGHVRIIFEKLLPEALETGVVFSNLTPFSHAFYRKFGYELACARNQIRIPTQNFAALKLRGTFSQVFPGDDTTELAAIHRAYIANLNHGICRDYWPENRAWRVFTKNDPYATGIFLYMWRNSDGKARGYIKYEGRKEGDENIMHVIELAFMDIESLYGVLSFIHGFNSQYKVFVWPMPTFLDPTDFIAGMWEIEQRIIPRDMTRVVNVKAALKRMRHPAGEGSYILDVIDENLSANQNRYLVEYGPEGSHVSIVKNAQKDADMRCTIPVLSQLVMGYRTLENALLSKQTGLEVLGNTETLNKVWTLRPQHLTEYF